jgi:hypothetical protein
MGVKLINKGDKVIMAFNSGIEDFVEEGEEVTIIQVKREGENNPAFDMPFSEDHYWIDKIGLSPYAGLIRPFFK